MTKPGKNCWRSCECERRQDNIWMDRKYRSISEWQADQVAATYQKRSSGERADTSSFAELQWILSDPECMMRVDWNQSEYIL